MFTRYKRSSDKSKVLLLYLILNNYDLSKVEMVEDVETELMFGVELKKTFGITNEFVDVTKIESELKEIRTPIICSSMSYEMYSTAKTIYVYRAGEKNQPLYINDMGIISPLMVISQDYIVTSNKAKSLEDSESKGFMYFAEYVTKGNCNIGSWEITYIGKEFKICYVSKNGHKELLYHALELDQTSTFKLVLYIIKKTVDNITEFSADNFTEETWRLEG